MESSINKGMLETWICMEKKRKENEGAEDFAEVVVLVHVTARYLVSLLEWDSYPCRGLGHHY